MNNTYSGRRAQLVGRIGEFIAYHFLKQKGRVTYDVVCDFRLDDKPVEVKSAFEHHAVNAVRPQHQAAGSFSSKQQFHTWLCNQDGLYCFVLLKDDGYASVKLVKAREVPKVWKGKERIWLSWTHFFQYEKVDNWYKRCTAPSYMEWKSLVYPETLQRMESE